MKKLEYTKPVAEIVRFANEDIITSSCNNGQTKSQGCPNNQKNPSTASILEWE